jgi:stage III sporulation protein AE
MKNRIIILTLLFIAVIANLTYAQTSTDEIIDEQESSFGISSFIAEAEKYSGDFFEDVSISKMLNDAISGEIDNSTIYKKIFNLLGAEVKTSIKTMLTILIIIIIHSVLKSISDSLEASNVSQIIYYVQYILIVTLIMTNFADIIDVVKETSGNLVGFMNMLIPLLVTLMIYTGSAVTSNLIEPILLFMINFLGNVIEEVLVPLVLIIAVFAIISKVSDKIQIDKLSGLLKSGVIWFLGIALTLFVSVVSLEGTLSSSIDGITAKTTKAAVSNMIPVVGKVLGDAVDSVLGCGVVLKNAIGIVGVVVVLGICITPVLKLAILTIAYNLVAGIAQPIADNKIVKLLEEMAGIFKLLLAILCSISVMLIIGITLVIKISNSGMMYR